MTSKFHTAPFPYFGGKRTVVADVWARLGRPNQYLEPFCGSAAMLLGNKHPASLEVIGDQNFYIANFWRAVKYQPDLTACEADYPVSHVDLDARHRWLTEPARTAELRAKLADPEWPGDARIAGWWVWGQCAWIGSEWCEKKVSNAGPGVQSQIPHVSNAGHGVQSQIPHVSDAGRGVQSKIPRSADTGVLIQSATGAPIAAWFDALAQRLARVRVMHGNWTRCLNHHYGNTGTAIFFDPPYVGFEGLYARGADQPVALAVADWCREHPHLRIALCGHRGDYDLPGWDVWEWSRLRYTMGGDGTRNSEAIWFSPACLPPQSKQTTLDLGATP